MNMNNRKKDY